MITSKLESTATARCLVRTRLFLRSAVTLVLYYSNLASDHRVQFAMHGQGEEFGLALLPRAAAAAEYVRASAVSFSKEDALNGEIQSQWRKVT